MNTEFRNRQSPYNSPFANVLVVIVGAIAIAVSFVIGIFAFFALAAIVIVLAATVGIRIWWFGVKARKNGGRSESPERPMATKVGMPTVIEGEFHVVPGEKDGDKLK